MAVVRQRAAQMALRTATLQPELQQLRATATTVNSAPRTWAGEKRKGSRSRSIIKALKSGWALRSTTRSRRKTTASAAAAEGEISSDGTGWPAGYVSLRPA